MHNLLLRHEEFYGVKIIYIIQGQFITFLQYYECINAKRFFQEKAN